MTNTTKAQIHSDKYQTALSIKNNIYKLTHESGLVRKKAREVLVEIGAPAVDFLVSFINHPDKKARWEAVKALSEINDPDAAPFLVDALTDDSSEIRWLAGEGLAKMGAKGIWAVFDALIIEPDSPFLRKGAHHVLARMSEIYDDPELKEFHEILDAPDAKLKIVLQGKPHLRKIIEKIRAYES
jgi:HEAT repeat protein